MNPYEKTAQEMKRQSEGPKRFAKAVGSAAITAGAYSFAPILARAAPFLSQYIPENLAIKGLTKVNPKFGKFIQSAFDSGYDFNEVKQFIGDQIQESQEEKPKEQMNIIQQYSPELHQFLDQEIKKGRNPIEAGAIAQNDKKYSEIIKKLSKDHKTSWSSIIESVFGSGKNAQPQQAQETQMSQPPQGGQGQAALMSILQKIQQARGGQ